MSLRGHEWRERETERERDKDRRAHILTHVAAPRTRELVERTSLGTRHTRAKMRAGFPTDKHVRIHRDTFFSPPFFCFVRLNTARD